MIYTSSARQIELINMGVKNNPFVAWNNIAANGTLSGTAVVTGGERENAIVGSTYNKWRPLVTAGSAIFSVDFGAATTISFAAMVAHNLATTGGAVVPEYSTNGSTWVNPGFGGTTPDDNGVMAFRFVATSARYWRFSFTAVPIGSTLSAGVMFFGNETIIPRRFYQGFSPILTPTEVQLQSNVSVGNELLGSSVIGRGSTLQTTVQYVDPDFVRGADWLAFQRHFNDGGGSFLGWRPDKYPQDIHYGWRNGPVIRPDNAGPRDLMSFNVQMQVYNART